MKVDELGWRIAGFRVSCSEFLFFGCGLCFQLSVGPAFPGDSPGSPPLRVEVLSTHLLGFMYGYGV